MNLQSLLRDIALALPDALHRRAFILVLENMDDDLFLEIIEDPSLDIDLNLFDKLLHSKKLKREQLFVLQDIILQFVKIAMNHIGPDDTIPDLPKVYEVAKEAK